MTRLLLLAVLAIGAYLVLVALSFRWTGNDDEPGGGITFAGGGA